MPKPTPHSNSKPGLSRRLLIGQAVASATLAMPWVWRSAQAQAASLPLTPAQTEGPYYPVAYPADSDADLLHNGPLGPPRGQPTSLAGSLTDVQGRPLSGAAVEIWQCDAQGHYHHPRDGARADPAFQGFGRCLVDAQGRWQFRTLRPTPYTGRTPHIHVKVKLGTRELLTTQLYVQDDPGNAGDSLWRRMSPAQRAQVTLPFEAGAEGLRAQVALVVRA